MNAFFPIFHLQACLSYHLPKSIRDHVDYVKPGINFLASYKRSTIRRSLGHDPISPGFFLPRLPDVNSLNSCDVSITPACIKALYKIPSSTKAHPDNAIGVYEGGQFYAQEDLDLFFANFTPYIPQGTHPILDLIDGAIAPAPVTQAGGEADLDLELIYPIVYPQEVVLYQVDGINYSTGRIPTVGGFNTFLDALDGVRSSLSLYGRNIWHIEQSYCTYSAFGETGDDPVLDPTYPDNTTNGYTGQLMCGVYKPTNVISISYLEAEIDLPAYYQERQCNE